MGVCVGCRAKKLPYIASMGIYVLKASAIRKLLYEHFPEVSSKPQLELGSRSTPHTSVMACACYVCNLLSTVVKRKERHYAFWRQFHEKPSIMPGCPGAQ